jgi:hypothetical protein
MATNLRVQHAVYDCQLFISLLVLLHTIWWWNAQIVVEHSAKKWLRQGLGGDAELLGQKYLSDEWSQIFLFFFSHLFDCVQNFCCQIIISPQIHYNDPLLPIGSRYCQHFHQQWDIRLLHRNQPNHLHFIVRLCQILDVGQWAKDAADFR